MHLVGVGPNEVIDLATQNLTVMQFCITRHNDVIPKNWCPLFLNYSQFYLLPIILKIIPA